MEHNYDFAGWATKCDVRCTDGRIIRKDAFKHCDGRKVPLVWNHQHTEPEGTLGHAILENRENGVYAYCKFNDTPRANHAKELVRHGDVDSLSIWANGLRQKGPDVLHGDIKEVSLVLAGANYEARIDSILVHGEEFDDDSGIIYTGETIELSHSETKEEAPMASEDKPTGEKTVKQVLDSMTDEQRDVVAYLVGVAAEGAEEVKHSDEGDGEDMKRNAFDPEETESGTVLAHADQEAILDMAKKSSVGTWKEALSIFSEKSGGTLVHGFEDYEELFPDHELLKKGAPDMIERDQSWISGVINGAHKSPFTRVRTRHADARSAEFKAKGYQKKGDEKTLTATMKLIGRTTDPQTIYIKDRMHRDDILDITEFDVVAYVNAHLRRIMNETLAMAILFGDQRDDGDPDKIHDTHIRPIWKDEELYTIHTDVDYKAMADKLQGTSTAAHFGENYIWAEAMIEASLYSREKFKGTGTPDMYCTPHFLNVMLLARDLNGRRIYDSKSDLARALNVGTIHTVEQAEGLIRTDEDGKKHELLALFVNMSDYQLGAAKGGQITRFEDFDINFNQYTYLLETRLSGALTNLWSAIAIEKPVDDNVVDAD